MFRRTRAFFFAREQTGRQTDRHRHWQTLIQPQTQTQTQIQIHRYTDTDTDTQTQTHRHRHTDKKTHTKALKLNPRDSRLEDVGLCPQRTKEARALTKP